MPEEIPPLLLHLRVAWTQRRPAAVLHRRIVVF
jgi:hypothetical protein